MLLSQGKTGNEIAAVQFALNGSVPVTPLLKVDGIFGPKTFDRVRQHQTKQGLKPDGLVGPLTFGSLFERVEMRGTSKIVRRTAPAIATPSSLGFAAPLRRPNLGPPLSPELQALARAQEAFLKWWSQPVPKPPLPTPGLLVLPTPGPFGPVVLPRTTHFQAPPAPAPGMNVQFKHEVEEGGDVTIHFQQETSANLSEPRKPKEVAAKFAIEWILRKGAFVELGFQPAVVKKKAFDAWSLEAEISLQTKPILQLQGGIFDVKLLAELAAAVSTELSASLEFGPKVDIEAMLIPGRSKEGGLKAILSVGGSVKGGYGPEDGPNGQEVFRWQTPFLSGTVTGGLGLVF